MDLPDEENGLNYANKISAVIPEIKEMTVGGLTGG